MTTKQNKAKVKNVIKGLKKASKLHAGQAKSLASLSGFSKGGTNKKKKGYAKGGVMRGRKR